MSLSATDIQVIALTYQLEKEKVGVEHLNSAPKQNKVIIPTGAPSAEAKETAGFYIPKKDRKSSETKSNEDENSDNDSSDDEDYETAEESETEDVIYLENVNCDEVLKKVNEEVDEEEEEEEDEDDDDDDEGWITPSNIKEVKMKTANELEEPEHLTVACLTTDFAMQNVLKQIGLNVVSLEGKLIRELRTYILRCYGCFKTTSIMTKVFCPNCGNKTLKRVGVSIEPDGTQRIHINFRKPLTSRGKKFTLPKFEGGKHANNPVLYEDQPMPQQHVSRVARMKKNPLDDDYIAGYSPFATRDVTSRSAMLGIRLNQEVKPWMRRNPNENKPCGKKSKRKK